MAIVLCERCGIWMEDDAAFYINDQILCENCLTPKEYEEYWNEIVK